MKTKSKPRHLNLTAAQARHLHETGSLLVVVACPKQPSSPPSENARAWRVEFNGEDQGWSLRRTSPWVALGKSIGKPGDVVLCREPWKFLDINELYVRYQSTADGDGRSKFYPAVSMPEWAIRLRPVIATVECRRVSTIKHGEAVKTGYAGHYDYRLAYWNRRYRRRGAEYAFDRAWGFFYTLTLEKGQ